MNRQRTAVSLLAIAGVVAVAYLGTPRAGSRIPARTLAVVPADATAVLRVQVPHVMASRAWRRLVHERGEDEGLESLRRRCGFDPLEGVRDLVIFVRSEPGRPLAHVGFVVRGQLDIARLSECVRDALTAEGGGIRRAEVEGLPAVAAAHGDSRVAFVGHEALIGGGQATVAAVARVLTGRAPSAVTGPLAGRYEQVAVGSDVSAVARLPREWRPALARVTGELEGLPADGGLPDEPVVALALDLSRGLGARASVAMSDAAAAVAWRDSLRRAIDRTTRSLSGRALGLPELASTIELRAQGPRLELSAELSGAPFERALGLIEQTLPAPRRADGPPEY